MTSSSHLTNLETTALHQDILSLSKRMLAVNADSSLVSQDLVDAYGSDLERITAATQKFHQLASELLDTNDSQALSPSEFWSHIRHDLRTPINAIKNYGEMILEDLEDSEGGEKTSLYLNLQQLVDEAQKSLPLIDEVGKHAHYDEAAPRQDTFADEEWYVPEDSTVLVIDDNVDNTTFLRRRLEKVGLTVLTCHDGLEGLKIARSQNVDLILLDILMPGVDGYETLEQLKQDIQLNGIPVLMISSISDISSIVKCIKLGADDYLPTPFNPVLLRARITACLEKKKMADTQKESMKRLASTQQQLTSAIESIDDGFALFDKNDRLTQHNVPFKLMYAPIFGILGDHPHYREFFQKCIEFGLFRLDRRKNETPATWLKKLSDWHQAPDTTLEQCLENGDWLSFREFQTTDGSTTVIHKNITDAKKREENLKFMALHDGLTGLVNRTGFEQSLEKFILRYIEERKPFSLVYIDLDNFKGINDTLGHEFGDEVLREAANRLRRALRDDDVVARLGGDEFALILNQAGDQEVLTSILDRVFKEVGNEVTYKGETGRYGLSAGLAEFPLDAKDYENLVKAADEAMYAAKNAGKNTYRFYRDLASVTPAQDQISG